MNASVRQARVVKQGEDCDATNTTAKYEGRRVYAERKMNVEMLRAARVKKACERWLNSKRRDH